MQAARRIAIQIRVATYRSPLNKAVGVSISFQQQFILSEPLPTSESEQLGRSTARDVASSECRRLSIS